jgi:hypothetical protein
VAIDRGLEVVDIEQIVAEFTRPDVYLFDMHHPKPEVFLEVLNVFINIALQRMDDADKFS